jgi:SAM-dependent methyltransferase
MASFIRSDVYDLPKVLDERFDVVYTSRGVLGWLPHIDAWAQVAASYVRPGGFFYITEIHPIAQVFNDDDGVTELKLRYPYFSQAEPLAFRTKGSYADRTARVVQEYEYSWNHGLGEIVSALAGAGLRIEFLHEFPFNEWPVSFLRPTADGTYRLPAEDDGRLPLSFSLKALKPTL